MLFRSPGGQGAFLGYIMACCGSFLQGEQGRDGYRCMGVDMRREGESSRKGGAPIPLDQIRRRRNYGLERGLCLKEGTGRLLRWKEQHHKVVMDEPLPC